MAERTPPDGGALADAEKTRYRVMLESIYRFRHFFVGFVFAILSFAMQFPVRATSAWVKVPEFAAWVLLAATGFFALKDCGGFAKTLTEHVVEGLETRHRLIMWILFFAAMALLLAAKIVDGSLSLIRP